MTTTPSPLADAFAVTFRSGKGRPTGMTGPGWVVIEPTGLRVVGSRARVDGSFYGALAFLLGGIPLALAAVLTFAGPSRTLLFAAIVGPILLSSVVHRVLQRWLPHANVDRWFPFDGLTCWGIGDAGVALRSDAGDFAGTTWATLERGEGERRRFFDEYATAQQGVPTYRDAPGGRPR